MTQKAKTPEAESPEKKTYASKALPNLPVEIVEWKGGYAAKLDTGAVFVRKDGCKTEKDACAYWDEISAFELLRRGSESAAIARFKKVSPAKETEA